MLTTGQWVTLLTIDSGLAMTHRYALEVCRVLYPQPVAYEGRKRRVPIVRQRGKPKESYLGFASDDILLDGRGLPFRADSKGGGVIAGNACYNLVGDVDAIRTCIEGRAVFPSTALGRR